MINVHMEMMVTSIVRMTMVENDNGGEGDGGLFVISDRAVLLFSIVLCHHFLATEVLFFSSYCP